MLLVTLFVLVGAAPAIVSIGVPGATPGKRSQRRTQEKPTDRNGAARQRRQWRLAAPAPALALALPLLIAVGAARDAAVAHPPNDARIIIAGCLFGGEALVRAKKPMP